MRTPIVVKKPYIKLRKLFRAKKKPAGLPPGTPVYTGDNNPKEKVNIYWLMPHTTVSISVFASYFLFHIVAVVELELKDIISFWYFLIMFSFYPKGYY